MEYSIYKLTSTRERFIELLTIDYGMTKEGNSKNLIISKRIGEHVETENVTIDYYYKLDPNEIDIDWANYWANYFDVNKRYRKTVESSYGMVLVNINGTLFGISLGRGHHYANKIADLDFGLDLAEMILVENTIQVKAAKYFKQSKNKSLTQYYGNSYVTPEIGESDELVIGKISLDNRYNDFILKNYSERVKFGTAIKINIGEYAPEDIVEIVFELYCIYNFDFKNRRLSLPRIIFLKENEDNHFRFADLNRTLLNSIIEEDNINVSLSYFVENAGDVVIEPTNDGQVEIIYSGRQHDISFNIESIRLALIALNCQDITKVTIRNKLDPSKREKLIKLLDFATIYENKNHCLYKGKWAIFNDSYIRHVESAISKVNEITIFDERYNLNNDILDEGRRLMLLEAEHDNVNYAEYPYNIFLSRRLGYTLIDRRRDHEQFQNIEFADLYNPLDENLIHVKIGCAKDMRYCIQQSLRSAQIFNRDNNVLNIYNVQNVNKVSMLFVLQTNNLIENGRVDFGKSRSMYLKVELIEWMNTIRSLNYIPEIIVARDVRN